MAINIADFEPFSTVDWPDKIVTTVFLQGCPWACEYCHNFDILDPKKEGGTSWSRIIDHLNKRKGLLDGVVFSGGEPLMQPGIVEAAKEVREMGFAVGLHTGGRYPKVLKDLLPHLNWVGFDIKAPWNKYELITHDPAAEEMTRKSLKILLGSGVSYQLRTTFDEKLLSLKDIAIINTSLKRMHAPETLIQDIRLTGTSPEFQQTYRNR